MKSNTNPVPHAINGNLCINFIDSILTQLLEFVKANILPKSKYKEST